MYRIRKVGIGSAFKIAAVITLGLWMVLGFLLGILASMSPGLFMEGTSRYPATFDFTSYFVNYLCAIPIYGIVGGLMGALYAFVYNIASSWVGGIEVEIDELNSQNFNPIPGYYNQPYSPQPPNYQPYSPPKQKNDWTPIDFDNDKPSSP